MQATNNSFALIPSLVDPGLESAPVEGRSIIFAANTDFLSCLGYNLLVILSGWKEIAVHLRCGMRTAQRWERFGLPINRPVPGIRSHVVADSEQLDGWQRDRYFRRGHESDVWEQIVRSRQLRADIRCSRETLHQRMDALRREVEAMRAATEQRDPASNERKPKDRGQPTEH